MTLPRLVQQDTDGVWKHHGTLIVANLQTPPGSITTEMLAPDAAEHPIGTFAQRVAWTLPTSNVWTESPIQVTLEFGGYLTRVEFTTLVSCPTKGQRVAWAMMSDGSILGGGDVGLGAVDSPENGFGSMVTGTYYFTSVPGTHRLALGFYGPANSKLFDAIVSVLYVTEQKR